MWCFISLSFKKINYFLNVLYAIVLEIKLSFMAVLNCRKWISRSYKLSFKAVLQLVRFQKSKYMRKSGKLYECISECLQLLIFFKGRQLYHVQIWRNLQSNIFYLSANITNAYNYKCLWGCLKTKVGSKVFFVCINKVKSYVLTGFISFFSPPS